MSNTRRLSTPIGGGGENGEKWQPKAEEKNGFRYDPLSANNKREGYLIETKEMEGKDGGKPWFLHVFSETNNGVHTGEKFSLAGDTVINEQIEKQVGKYGSHPLILIEYKGRELKKAFKGQQIPFSQTNSYHVWSTMVDEGAPSYASVVQESGITKTESSQAVESGNNQAPPTIEDDLPF